ncbi:MAG TPA: condensation domain-containing protein [Kofleriaceae bacterium]|jgi:hypothetical protein|nr:condensation domain-containing protein [Kofleriaceae bacterium]
MARHDKTVQPVSLGATSSRATIAQEYFWSMALDDPDPSTYSMSSAFVIEGALDVDVFRETLHVLVASHSVFRTALREVDGELRQIVVPGDQAPPFALEVLDRSPLPELEWTPEARRTVDELAARGFDLARSLTLRARLTQLDPHHHLLVVVFHHAVADGASAYAFFCSLFERYTAERAGTPLPDLLGMQYIDVAESFRAWADTPAGLSRAAYWRERLRDLPEVRVPADLPRDEVDARRDRAKHGITADLMHPAEYVKLADAAREGITGLARQHRVSIYGVYAAALMWLLHRQTGQTDLCIETTADTRGEHRAFANVQGPLVFWTLVRADLAGCVSFQDALSRVGRAIAEAQDAGPIPDYYRQTSHRSRRVVLNYVPTRWYATPKKEYPGLRLHYKPMAFPRWKRPWDLHLTIIDADDTTFAWTGNERLFRRETVSALLRQYLEIIERPA